MGALSSIRGFTPDSTVCRGIPHSPAHCVALWHHWMPQGFSAAMHLDPGRNSKCLPYLDGSCCFITEKPGAVWTYSCCLPLILLQVWDHLVPKWGSELQSVTARRQRDLMVLWFKRGWQFTKSQEKQKGMELTPDLCAAPGTPLPLLSLGSKGLSLPPHLMWKEEDLFHGQLALHP